MTDQKAALDKAILAYQNYLRKQKKGTKRKEPKTEGGSSGVRKDTQAKG